MSLLVREFRRSDRDQLTDLVNLHVSSVLPGVALSTNVVLSQLEREPGEGILDPWVDQRCCLVAERDQALVAAALVHRYGADSRVREEYRSAAELRWIVVRPSDVEAGRQLVNAVVEKAKGWEPSRLHVDGSLPAPGCYGVSDSWPHIHELLTEAGFEGPDRTELVLAAPVDRLVGHKIDQTEAKRSIGALGTRIDLVSSGKSGESLGYIEFGEMTLARSMSAATWTDVGNLFAIDAPQLATVMPALYSAAAEWLTLGGVDRIIDYYADDVHTPEYLATLHRLGFTLLSTNARGWELPLRS